MYRLLLFKRSGKEFHAAGPAQEKAGLLPYVDLVDILGRRDHRESLSADGAPFDVAGLPAQFRQV